MKGEVIEQAWAKIGKLYVRKSAFERCAASRNYCAWPSKPLAHDNGVGRGAPFPGWLLPACALCPPPETQRPIADVEGRIDAADW
jgi:hypothetical protein